MCRAGGREVEYKNAQCTVLKGELACAEARSAVARRRKKDLPDLTALSDFAQNSSHCLKVHFAIYSLCNSIHSAPIYSGGIHR